MTYDDYASQMRHLSELVIGAVHYENPDATLAAVQTALAVAPPPFVDPVVALVTILAAQVNPDATPQQRLGWVDHPGGEPLRPCGTEAAYKRHMRRRETPCRWCKAAHATSERDRAARAKTRTAA